MQFNTEPLILSLCVVYFFIEMVLERRVNEGKQLGYNSRAQHS